MTIMNGVARRMRKSLERGTGEWKFLLARSVVTESLKITQNWTVTPLNEVWYSRLKFDGAAFKKLEGLCVYLLIALFAGFRKKSTLIQSLNFDAF